MCCLGGWKGARVGAQENGVEAPDGGTDFLVVDMHEVSVAVEGDNRGAKVGGSDELGVSLSDGRVALEGSEVRVGPRMAVVW